MMEYADSFDLSKSEIIGAHVLGQAVDGRLVESLLLSNRKELQLAYIVILDSNSATRKYRPISVVPIDYESAKSWNRRYNPGKPLSKIYKPDWMKFV